MIELLVVMAIMATLLALVSPRYFRSLEISKEVALKQDLSVMREVITQFHADKGRYPASLDELVQQRYLKAIPIDPVTGSGATWLATSPPDVPTGGLYDIRSGAEGNTSEGIPYGGL